MTEQKTFRSIEAGAVPELNYKVELPLSPRPIVVIGAGGIVGDAHLPAYKKAGFQVFGIVNRTIEKAKKLAADFDIPQVFGNIEEAVAAAPANAVYDLALMPAQYIEVLSKLPPGAPVLIQKPLGDSLTHAREICDLCEQRAFRAAVNFQLRYAPFVMAARRLIESGLIGDLYDLEVRLTTFTPWEIFPLVAVHPRLEVLYHSVHYIDMIRSFLGNPRDVTARSFRHPLKSFASTRSTILMDYGDSLRAVINTNHDHDFGPDHQESFIKWEGTKGAVKAKMGLLLDYPRGLSDAFWYCSGDNKQWHSLDLEGSWFPDAFTGPMADLMRYSDGAIKELPTGIDDVIHTMEAVEKAYESN